MNVMVRNENKIDANFVFGYKATWFVVLNIESMKWFKVPRRYGGAIGNLYDH